MKVFISWSGNRSKEVATLLSSWLSCVIQAIHPWMSSKDIDKGALWFLDITNQLVETKIGIICITQENKNNPWILFEAGAMAKGLSSNRVCTLLIDLEPKDLKDPLAQLNHTFISKESFLGLLHTINKSLTGDRKLQPEILEKSLETYWPGFETQYQKIIKDTSALMPKIIERSQPDMLAELLAIARGIDKKISTTKMLGESFKELDTLVNKQKRMADSIPATCYFLTKNNNKYNESIEVEELQGRVLHSNFDIRKVKVEGEDGLVLYLLKPFNADEYEYFFQLILKAGWSISYRNYA